MEIIWDKKLIKFSNGSYVAWGIKRKKFFFTNKNELKLNCTILSYLESQIESLERVIADKNKIIEKLTIQLKESE